MRHNAALAGACPIFVVRDVPEGCIVVGQAICDAHMRVFLQSISAAAEAPGQGFAAIKVSLLLGAESLLWWRAAFGLSCLLLLLVLLLMMHQPCLHQLWFWRDVIQPSSIHRTILGAADMGSEGAGGSG